ncbi:MAG: UDP-3-O-(3-hydroxymyristoyl)glucosamine N-acyltransferase [Deltaproteobacteria bacterium]|nr:UDP-3-O-(3-hydroxymyristoyl)glucosamine N-acyltransferase [Candidatus Anaeroferrophillus wilburensis]MBN2889750.1 UDP-3-O-(3-hydroxymyristoyl)glucosamine N-acyltransferase [Deltaproteobacteria bacterium]
MPAKQTNFSVTLAELAAHVDGELLSADPGWRVTGIAPLQEAGPQDVTFFHDRKLAALLPACRAGVVIVAEQCPACGRPQIIVPRPDLTMICILELFYPPKVYGSGVARGAFVAASAKLGEQVFVAPGAYVGEGTIIHDGVVLCPGVVVGDRCVVGAGSILYPNVTMYDGCRIGQRCRIHAGTVIGSDGYAFTRDGEQHRKIPQVGIVEIGDDVELGANNTIDRAALTVTRIANGVKTDNLVHIAHNVEIGEHSLLVAQVGIAGSTKIGRSVILAGQAGITGHVTIGDSAIVGPQAGVSRDIAPGEVVSGSPQMPHRDWLKAAGLYAKLPEMRKKMRQLEHEMAVLKQRLSLMDGDDND